MRTERKLAYSSEFTCQLARNPKHVFALNHALCLYPSDSIYTYIPKNACSTLRLSLAIENGCIESESDIEWIHLNNETFAASLSDLLKAKYTFTFLRCPFRRLASVFLDKIITMDRVAWHYFDSTEKSVKLEEVSFSMFVRSLRKSKVMNSNHHWRPQVDFLVYQSYDDYFCVESMEEAAIQLKEKIDFTIQDAREKTKHGLDGYELDKESNYSKLKASQLHSMKLKNKVPDYPNLYDEELIEIVSSLYAKDLELYKEQFGESNLLFTSK